MELTLHVVKVSLNNKKDWSFDHTSINHLYVKTLRNKKSKQKPRTNICNIHTRIWSLICKEL